MEYIYGIYSIEYPFPDFQVTEVCLPICIFMHQVLELDFQVRYCVYGIFPFFCTDMKYCVTAKIPH